MDDALDEVEEAVESLRRLGGESREGCHRKSVTCGGALRIRPRTVTGAPFPPAPRPRSLDSAPMSLRWQIITGFGILLVPLALVAITAFAVIGRLGGAVDAVLSENDRSLRAVATMDVSLERLDSAALLALLERNDEADEIAGVHRARFRGALADAASNLTIAGEGEAVAAVEAAFERYDDAFEDVVGSDHETARAAYVGALVPAFDDVREGLQTLREMNQAAALVTAKEAGSLARWGLWSVAVASLLAVVLAAWAAVKLSGQIAEPFDKQHDER